MVKKMKQAAARRHYLREWRISLKLTQEQLGARLNTDKAQVSNWENDKRGLAQSEGAIADALGISREDLYRHPAKQSPADLLKDNAIREAVTILSDATEAQKTTALDMLRIITRKPGTETT